MKYLLFLLFAIPFTAIAQSDTSRKLITIEWKQKHLAYMGAELASKNAMTDIRLRDTLAKYVGAGGETKVSVKLPAGYVIRYVNALFKEPGGEVYSTLNELATSTAGQGWAGLVAQLMVKKAGNGSEKLVATWLFNEISTYFTLQKNNFDAKPAYGVGWLTSKLDYN